MKTKAWMTGLAVGILASGVAQAALNDRGSGLLYDDVLNVTWLQDANYAKTSGYDADGRLNWSAANTWAANLVYHDSVRNVDYSDWRLAANTPVGANWNYNVSYNGSTDLIYDITSPASELSYMYYVNLGLKALYSTAGVYQYDAGVFPGGGQADIGLVKNLQSSAYWSGTAFAPDPASNAWMFSFGSGGQDYGYGQSNLFYAWAVRPGDVAGVAAVPEPETYAMMLAGLGLLGFVARRRKQKTVQV
jgi:PEP-CTERM motif